jgi:hypothetical protein
VAGQLAENGKLFTDAGFVKSCILATSEEVCHEKIKLFQGISLSVHTVTQQIKDLVTNFLNS